MTRAALVFGALVFGALVFGAPAFAAPALASYSPKLIVGGAGSPVSVEVKVAAADAPTARAVIYVPPGYRLGSPPAGTRLGNVAATAAAGDLAGAVLPLKGSLVVVAPSSLTAAQRQDEQQCLGAATPSQVWAMRVSAAGQELDVPVYVVDPAGSEQAFAVAKLVICLPPPDVPVGTPGRAAFGAKLLSASFASSAIAGPTAAGDYRWRSLWTPYTPAKGTANLAGTVEAQGLVRIPGQIAQKISARKRVTTTGGKKHTAWLVTVTGKVTQHGAPVAGVRVAVLSGKTRTKLHRAVSTRTNAAGAFVAKTVVSAPSWFRSGASVPLRDLGAAGCTQTFAPAPCIDATVGASRLVSTLARSRG